jgi:hypothetical protein
MRSNIACSRRCACHVACFLKEEPSVRQKASAAPGASRLKPPLGKETKTMDIAIIPRKFLERFDSDPARRIHLNVLMSHLLFFLVATMVVCLSIDLSIIPHVCLSQEVFGIPCPGCGITSSLLACFVGDFNNAWIQNPAGPIIGVGLVAQVPLRVLALRGANWSRRAFRVSRIMATSIVIVLIVNWIHQIT